jgi:hypothetical protein
VAVSCDAWPRRQPRFRPRARKCWASSQRNKSADVLAAGRRVFESHRSTRRERRGSAESIGLTRRCNRMT